MDKNILFIALMSSYMLIFANVLIVIFTISVKLKLRMQTKKYQRVYNQVYKDVENFIKGADAYNTILYYIKNKLKRQIVLDIMLAYSKENKIDLQDKFNKLGYISALIFEAKKRLDFDVVKKLGLIGAKEAFPVLYDGTQNKDYELSYQCYYSLSLLNLDKDQIAKYVQALLGSNIIRNRIIEMVGNLQLSMKEYFDLLEDEKTELGKVVFLRVLDSKLDNEDEALSDTLVHYLYDVSKEVRISAVICIASTHNNKYFEELLYLFEQEQEWEVRAMVAKVIGSLATQEQVTKIKNMMYDSQWWVKYNAAYTLSQKGVTGVQSLIEAFLGMEDEQVSDLAYYILDSNPDINKTLMALKEE